MKLYIIGGRPCSGKTTIAHKLGLKSGLEVIYGDLFALAMVHTSDSTNQELLKWKNQALIDILQDDPNKLAIDYINFHKELNPLILKELLSKGNKDLILEGTNFLPEFVKELEKHFDVEVQYIKTSDDFVNEKYVTRDYVIELLKHDNGQNALLNLLERDRLYSKYMYKSAHENNYDVFEIMDNIDFEKLFSILLKNMRLNK